jgi:hypothetical protein
VAIWAEPNEWSASDASKAAPIEVDGLSYRRVWETLKELKATDKKSAKYTDELPKFLAGDEPHDGKSTDYDAWKDLRQSAASNRAIPTIPST